MTQTADNESNVQNRKKRVAFHQNNDAECKKKCTTNRTYSIRPKVRTQRM